MLAQWDDHEVTNNWWPGEPLTRAEHQRKKYARRTRCCWRRARSRAFHEYMPMRADAGRSRPRLPQDRLRPAARRLHARHAQLPRAERRRHGGGYGPAAYFLGAAAVRVAQARADAVARDLEGDRRRHAARPVVVYDGDREMGLEAVAQGDGPPLGRELEIADLLVFIKHAGIRNMVWITADVHYTAAHHYDPTGGVPGLRAVLGVRLRPAPRRRLRPERSTTRSARSSSLEGAEPEQGRPVAERRACSSSATWRSTARPGDDGDAQGRRRPLAVVDQARTKNG